MSQQQVQQRPSALNGIGRRRSDRDVVSRPDAGFRSDTQNWRSSQPSRPASASVSPSPVAGHAHGQHHSSNNLGLSTRSTGERDGAALSSGKSAGNDGDPHRMALVHYCNCLIGQHVDVQMKNGRVYTGIYHTALLPNHGGEFGVVLKYARMTKDTPLKGGKSTSVRDAARKPALKILNVHSEEFMQIIAKDVTIYGDAVANGRLRDNKSELLTDSSLATGKQKEVERELKPWQPDEEAPRNLALDTTFQSTWNRNWDQFETNKALFGVESTFNEELYTTKLERGSHMREREREAQRIAKEIETTSTRNVHLAEERGVRLTPELESLDEEARFSSVLRGNENRDMGEDDEDGDIDGRNQETFGGVGSSSPSYITVSTSVAQEPESRGSRPSSAESAQTTNGPSKRDPSVSLRDTRTASIEKGEMAALDSFADTHREHLRLRHILVGDNRKRSNKGPGSPYHSGRASPLHSPLVGDPTTIQALNLDPSCPNVPEEVFRSGDDLNSRREFHEFKMETAKKGSKKQREDQVNELKSFSESFKERTKKDVEPRSPRTQPKLSIDTTSSGNRHPTHDSSRAPSSCDVKSSLGAAATTHLPSATTPAGPTQSSQVEASETSTSPAGVGAVTGSPSLIGVSSATNVPLVELTGLLPAGSSVTVAPAGGVSVSLQQSPTVTSGGTVPSTAGSFSLPQQPGPEPISIPTSSGSTMGSSMVSPASSATSASSTAANKSTLKKEFKLNPNAKSFTPSFPRPASPMIQNQVYMQTGLPPGSPLPAMTVGVNLNQYLQQQPGQPAQYVQDGNGLGGPSVSAAPYLQQPPGSYVPGVPGAGGPPVLQGQPSIKLSSQSQQQLQVVSSPYAQQQVLRYPPQGPPLQPAPAYLQPHGQLYPQQMMYSQPGLVYVPYPQGMIPGQPIQGQPVPSQGPLPPQPAAQQSQQQKHRGGGGGIQSMHYAGAYSGGPFLPPFLPGQQHHIQQSPISHLHNSLQPAQSGMAPAPLAPGTQVSQGVVAGAGPSVQTGVISGAGNSRGKGGVGNFQQQ